MGFECNGLESDEVNSVRLDAVIPLKMLKRNNMRSGIVLESSINVLEQSLRRTRGVLGFLVLGVSALGAVGGYRAHQVMQQHHDYWFGQVEPRLKQLESKAWSSTLSPSTLPPLILSPTLAVEQEA